MADTLVKLIIFVLSISFRPITSDVDPDQGEVNINLDQHVKEESTAGKRSEEDHHDQASAAENAEPVEGQGSPGFLSRIISEIAAPLYEEEEEDFLSEDNNRKPDIRSGDNAAEDSSEHSPEEDQGSVVDTLEKKGQMESDVPQFTISKYLKSVTEDSQATRIAINSEASILFPVGVTSIISSWTPTPHVEKIVPTKAKTTAIPATTATTKATPDLVVITKEMLQPSSSSTGTSTATVMTQTSRIYTPQVVHPEDAEVVEPPKVVFGASEALENETKTNTSVLSAYAVFMRAFRNFHDGSFQVLMSYWPAVRSGTRDVLACVGLGSMFEQLCNDLAYVHPAVLFGTFLFGTLGIFYFMWSLTLGRTRHGAQGPHLRGVHHLRTTGRWPCKGR